MRYKSLVGARDLLPYFEVVVIKRAHTVGDSSKLDTTLL
jgi:hypothetical protein